eukprot:CAMPEP_0175878990 /NCGR_PEP_ID=MMETSP0107_2-20121207/41513_1 /TAXON_ID=195067 ORGANISM="Goniomonas pacifica, Strain CCMP1869" /NCGR_SAMPLE_ID=MMETSP0107_2 /ASSEMBLY_ACC=CAM_ASM_000203 /LENGTH=89 /DNA_ID=CAMNT_0017198573 /DNA_START=295 /DNA_END=564 /DNA_ORIENTATION=-
MALIPATSRAILVKLTARCHCPNVTLVCHVIGVAHCDVGQHGARCIRSEDESGRELVCLGRPGVQVDGQRCVRSAPEEDGVRETAAAES